MTEFRSPSGGDDERSRTSVTGRGSTAEPTTQPTRPTLPVWRTTRPAAETAAAPASPSLSAPRRRWSIWRGIKWLVGIGFLAAMTVLGLVIAYRFVPPPITATILGQRLTGQHIVQRWVPIERMSPTLILAVISSEDSGYCRHHGVDWRELAEVVESARDGTSARGGSTIPMQTVKNLFLWSSKSYVRKALEIPITLVADPIWGKRRTMEIYLNIAEWGPGIFGAEAAAQYHFKKSAARLTEMEAALLAAALPSPIARDSGDPGAQQQRLAQRLVERMRQAPAARLACLSPGT